MASAEIIAVGTELLLGQLVDTNSGTIAAGLAEIGMDVYRHMSVGDNEARIAQAVREALERADAVICAGGLGPTVDDLTREAVASATGRALELNQPVVEDLRAFFASLGRPMSPNNARQALFPRGSTVIENPHGTAPGFFIETGGKLIVAMPGPPRELEPMLREHVLPLLRGRFGSEAIILTRVLRTAGVSESLIDSQIADLFRAGINPSIAVLSHVGEVDIKITAKAASREAAAAYIDQLEAEIRNRVGDCIFSSDGSSLPEALGRALRARDWSISTAESCTGGMIGSMITAAAGSSNYYRGGIVSYSDEAKTRLLDVAPELIEQHGAVSEEVAGAMAIGAKAALRSTIAIAVTGIAGPDGGTDEKPVGFVYIALAGQGEHVNVRCMRIPGNRHAVQRRASLAALMAVWRAARETVRA